MDNSYQIEFIKGKQVGETDSGHVYKVYRQQRGGETDRFQQESRKIWLQSQFEHTKPGFIEVRSKKYRTAKRDAETTLKQ